MPRMRHKTFDCSAGCPVEAGRADLRRSRRQDVVKAQCLRRTYRPLMMLR